MKRIEIEIDDETDALLEELLAGDEANKPAVLRGFVESGVLRMAAARPATDPRAGNGNDSAPPWTPLKTVSIDEARAMIEESRLPRRDATVHEPLDDVAPPDPLDAIVGSIHDDPVDDIDEVIYGR
jgi:hypothetical protein